MAAFTDNQTLTDLALTDNQDANSIIHLFKPKTLGGMYKLKAIFAEPVTSISRITQRLDTIKYLQAQNSQLNVSKEEVDFLEYYLNHENKPTQPSRLATIERQIKSALWQEDFKYIKNRGIGILKNCLAELSSIFKDNTALPDLLREFYNELQLLKTSPFFQLITKEKLSAHELLICDYTIRNTELPKIRRFLDALYMVDVFIAVANVARADGYDYPVFYADEVKLDLKEFFHPLITNPIKNSIEFSRDKNLCLMTGANMSGKSSLLKAIGICLYLAHIGFPVPAAEMHTGLYDGLYTTINLADDIVAGHSHFYKEVIRIKDIAEKIAEGSRMLIIFDELFRGTNVQDANDASLAVIRALAKVKNSVFVMSTHIVEVTDELQTTEKNIFFKCLHTAIIDRVPQYNYQLQDGISKERLGMWIVEQERLVETINKGY